MVAAIHSKILRRYIFLNSVGNDLYHAAHNGRENDRVDSDIYKNGVNPFHAIWNQLY